MSFSLVFFSPWMELGVAVGAPGKGCLHPRLRHVTEPVEAAVHPHMRAVRPRAVGDGLPGRGGAGESHGHAGKPHWGGPCWGSARGKPPCRGKSPVPRKGRAGQGCATGAGYTLQVAPPRWATAPTRGRAVDLLCGRAEKC